MLKNYWLFIGEEKAFNIGGKENLYAYVSEDQWDTLSGKCSYHIYNSGVMKLTYLMATSGSTLSEGLRMYHYIQPLASYVSNDGKLMKFNGWQLRMSKTPSFDDAVATFKADLLWDENSHTWGDWHHNSRDTFGCYWYWVAQYTEDTLDSIATVNINYGMTAEGLAALKSKGWAVVSGNEFATDLVKEHFVIQKLFAKDTPIFDGEKACVLDEEFLFYSKFGWTPSYEVDPDQDVMESNCTITLSNSFETKGNVYDKSTKDGLSGASIFVLDIDGEPLFDEPIVTDSDGDYEITLTDEQFANIGHVYLTKDGYIDRFVEGDVLFQPIDKHNTNIDMEKELEADFKLYDQSATSIFEGFMVYGRFHTKGTIVQISDEPQKDLSTTLQIGARIGEGSLPREEKINSLSSKDEERDLYYQAEQWFNEQSCTIEYWLVPVFKDEVNGRNPIPACWLYNDMVVEPGSSSEIIVSEDDETPIQILLVTRGSVEVEVNTSSVEGLDHYSIELTRYYPQTKRTETKTYILDETTKIFKDDIFVGTKLMKQPDGSLRFEFVGVPEPNHVKSLSAVNADEDYYMETGILRAHTAEGYELTNWWYQPEGQDAQIVPDEGYQFGRVDKVTVSAEINEIIVPPTPDPEPLNPVNNNVNNGAAKTSDDNALMVIALLLVLTASICSVEALRRKQWNK